MLRKVVGLCLDPGETVREMECPFCQTENRNDRETCYHCGKDLSMLRLISNKARHHYNLALEHAERHRYYEAIAELQNALDLDSKLSEAHVVLGTVYARLNRTEEARAEWQNALAVSKAHEKAHIYLEQMERIQPYRGLLRRLRFVLGAFAATLVVCAVLLVWILRPNVPAWTLDRAWKSYQADDLEKAQGELDTLSRPLSDPALELSAKALATSLDRDLRDVLRSMEELRRQDQPYQAAARAEEFLKRNPPQAAREAVMQSLLSVRVSIAESLRNRIAGMGNSPGDLDQVEMAVSRFVGAFPEAPERESLVHALARAEARYTSARLESIREAYRRSKDPLWAIAALKALQTELQGPEILTAGLRPPALLESIQAEIQRITAEAYDTLLAQARNARDAGNLQEATAALDQADRLEGLGPAQRAELTALRQNLARKERSQLLASLQTRVAEHDWDGALAIADRLSTATLDPETKETVQRLTADARKARAVEDYSWLMRRADDLEHQPLAPDQAREVLRRAEIVLRDLPFTLYPAALDDTLFFLARAQQALGRKAEAHATFERLRRECPKSPYLAEIPLEALQASPPTPS